VKDVLDEINESTEAKGAQFLVDPLPSLFVSRGLIQPLFHNLISNALKYSKKDVSPVIKIYSEMSENITNGNGNSIGGNTEPIRKYCRILIQDNGIGFEQKYAEEIFGMFKRLHHAKDYEGTGIGLALCKKIVEQHNGFISARSKIDEGSTFIVSLPVSQ
jgi:light-regulated signal transduction histidine kinase (bacteriophytochrome)